MPDGSAAASSGKIKGEKIGAADSFLSAIGSKDRVSP